MAEADWRDPDALILTRWAIRKARKVARRIAQGRSYEDDLENAALFGLWQAARRFDPSRGASWASVSGHAAWRSAIDELRRLKPCGIARQQYAARARADDPLVVLATCESLLVAVPSGDDPAREAEARDESRHFATLAGEKYGPAVAAILRGANQKEAAVAAGVSAAAVSLLLRDHAAAWREGRASWPGMAKAI